MTHERIDRFMGGAVRGARSIRAVLRSRTSLSVLSAGAALTLLAACAGPDDTSESASPEGSALAGSVTVFAAASLTSAFTDLAERFEAENPVASVQLNFAGSSDLVTQITEGAPADVFASADEKNMAKLIDGGLTDSAAVVDFATNVLTIAVPKTNPAGITGFADLARPGVKTVVCAPQVPCGAAALLAEEATGVTLSPVSEESSVTDVLGKVSSGEADAGLVYATDVLGAAGAVASIDFPEAEQAVNTYPIAALNDSASPDLAQAFVDYVAGPEGRRVLSAAGFGSP